MRSARRGSAAQLSKGADVYRIGELAACSGLTTDTLRYYERVGLVPKAARYQRRLPRLSTTGA